MHCRIPVKGLLKKDILVFYFSEPGDGINAACGCIAQGDSDCCVDRQVDIQPGTKPDESHLGGLFNRFPGGSVTDDPAGHISSDLSDEYFGLLIADHHRGSFIQVGGFWMPGQKVFPGMVFKVFDFSGDREPVDMYIVDTHKDGDQDSIIVEIFILADLLYSNHFSVCRCHHRTSFNLHYSSGDPEKPEYEYQDSGKEEQ